MVYRDTKIYKRLKQKAYDEQLTQYLAAIERICNSAVTISTQVVRTFPTFTLHNEVHFCNVLEIMANLIGEQPLSALTIEELAMLLLSACCHDLGMSVSKKEYDALSDTEHLHRLWYDYFKKHPDKKHGFDRLEGDEARAAYLKASIPNLVREFHHIRIMDVVNTLEWDDILVSPGVIEMAPLTPRDLALVCKSHGESLTESLPLLSSGTADRLDLKMCAALLRLGDILDFDPSRAPRELYRFLDLSHPDNPETAYSKTEWDKHLSCRKFVISFKRRRSGAYTLPYSAVCDDPDVYKGICGYLAWVDKELECCNSIREEFDDHLSEITFPYRVSRNITEKPYRYPFTELQHIMRGCIDWLFGLPAHWGPFDSDTEPQNANMCEVLMAIRMSGFAGRRIQAYNSALAALLKNVTGKGLISKSLKTETVQCTSLLLQLISHEKRAAYSIIQDFSQFDIIAENLWKAKNDTYGWGVYVMNTGDDDCSMTNTCRALKAINQFPVAGTSEYREYVVKMFSMSSGGRFGFTLSDKPKLITTAMMLCLYFDLDEDVRRDVDKHYDAVAAVDYIFDKFVNGGIQLEIETFRGIEKSGCNTVKKSPWNNITIGYAVDALVSAYRCGLIDDIAFSQLNKRVKSILNQDIQTAGSCKYCYIPDSMERFKNKTPTYPTAYFLYGMTKLREQNQST